MKWANFDKFLQGSAIDVFYSGENSGSPLINDFVFSRSTLNVDSSINFKLTDFASLTVEGLNLTNQTSDRYAYQGQNAVTQYASAGRVFRAGVRVRF